MNDLPLAAKIIGADAISASNKGGEGVSNSSIMPLRDPYVGFESSWGKLQETTMLELPSWKKKGQSGRTT